MIKISKRLEEIALNIEANSKVLDIGCDHGYLSIYLKQLNKNIEVIASDINENALNMAKTNIKNNHLDKVIETRLGNGLDVIKKDEVDTIVLSGMGGMTIIGIIKNNLDKINNIKKIIIQSNTDIMYVRKNMIKLGFMITNEQLIKDKFIYYTIITFSKGNKKYNKKELYFGPILLKNNSEIFKEKRSSDLIKLKRILKSIPYTKLLTKLKIYKLVKLYK